MIVVRTVVSLDPEDKEWLDRKAQQEHVPMTELVRRAVRRMREESTASPGAFETLLRETSGIWRAGDGLSYQRRLREEWAGRP